MDSALVEQARAQADLCSVFGSTTRVLIIWALDGREMSVSEIAEAVGASLQNASQHLRLMRDRGIVCARQDGNTTWYRLVEDGPLHQCIVLKRARAGQVRRANGSGNPKTHQTKE